MPEDQHLYQQISQTVRQEIQAGRYKPGDRLPSIREMTARWNCTPGTVQRAYRELAEQGLVVSRPGQGTHVQQEASPADDTPLRKARLVHKAQSFLLEVLTAGYSPAEVETAVQLALDQWRVLAEDRPVQIEGVLRFAGSHDLALAWIAAHFSEIAPKYRLDLNYCGSLGGLFALAEGKCDLAGIHLWDRESDSYNLPYVRRTLPGIRVALLTLAWRWQGLIIPKGNRLGLKQLSDLTRPGLRFINRQPGSGTRVWLDSMLQKAGVASDLIQGYQDTRQTHSEIAREVAEGNADAGFGLQTAAQAFGLSFVPLLKEKYDLVIPETCLKTAAVEPFVRWLQTPEARHAIAELGGYETEETGQLTWLEPE